MGIVYNAMWIIIYGIFIWLVIFVIINKTYVIKKAFIIPSAIINVLISIGLAFLNGDQSKDISIGIPLRYLILHYTSNSSPLISRYGIAFQVLEFAISVFITILFINIIINTYRILRKAEMS